MAAHPALRRARAFPQLPGGLRAPAPTPLYRGDQCLGGRPLPSSPEVGDNGALPSRPSSTFIYCVKALGPLSGGRCPSWGRGPAFSTSSRAARRSYLCSCHLSYSVENSPRGSGPPALGCESKGLYLGPLSLSWSKLAMSRVEGTPQISSPLLHHTEEETGRDRYPLLSLHPMPPSHWKS